MPDKLKLICERLMLEIEFKKLDLKITREEFRAANNDFNSELQKYLEILSEADRNVVVAKMNNKIHDISRQSWKQDISPKCSPETRRIFKKIANKTHPDKLLNEEGEAKEKLLSSYKRAQAAMADDSLFDTMKVAKELGIEYDIDEEKRLLLQQELSALDSEIGNLKKTLPWQWKRKGAPRKVIKDFVYRFLIE